jgi:hypothetical protein
VQADACRPQPSPRPAVPGDHHPRLARADHPRADEHRSRLKVVVTDVVRCHLVVPEEPAAAGVEHKQRVGEECAAGKGAPVRPLRCTAPRRRVRVSAVEAAARIDRDRIPETAAPGMLRPQPRVRDRDELPAHCARCLIECVDRAAPRGRVPDRADEDEVFPDHRCDIDELLAAAGQVTPPQLTSCRGVESERVRVGVAVDAPVNHGEPVRTIISRAVTACPAECSRRALDCEDVAAQVLDVDGVAVRDRRRREDAREAWFGRKPEAPLHSETSDVAACERRVGRRARPRKVAVRERPGPVRATRAATAEQHHDRRRDRDASWRERTHRSLLP